MKLISIIIPTYKAEKYIQQTITSVLSQTYLNFEVIIVDDESPDRSIEICQQFYDPRIRIIHQNNRGLAGARNTGIRHAKGDYLAFLDADDLWLPEKLALHVQHLENNPEIGVSFSRSRFIDEKGQYLGVYQMPKLTDITPEHLLCRNPIGNGSAPVLRREVFADICFQENLYGTVENFYFDETFRQSEDIECWFRIATQTDWKIAGIPDALTLYRVNTDGLSANILKQLDSWEKLIEKHRVQTPNLVKKWEIHARAYQLRYLARRAVRLKDGQMALKLINQAMLTDWTIILNESSRTLCTLIAAYLLNLLSLSIYPQLEGIALKVLGYVQRMKIAKEQLRLYTH